MRPSKYPLPECLRNLSIIGFEDDEDKKKTPKEGEENESDDDEDDDDDDDEDGEKGGDKGNAGLKSALQKERKERRKLERENKRLSKAQKEREDSEKDEATKAKDEATAEKTKTARLATRLKDTALDNSIIKLAGNTFVDIDDVLSLIDREAIEIEQDEDDPSDIEIDERSVKRALLALQEKKPHLVRGEQKLPPPKSGSKMTGGGDKSKDQLDEEALMSKYSALRRGSR